MTPSPNCPLCASAKSIQEDTLTTEDIQMIWRHVGVELSANALESLAGAEKITRWRCQECRLAFFDPVLPGNGTFYSDLQHQLPDYYQPTRPAFDRALRFAKASGYSEVLDVGCGGGAFLDQAKRVGLRTMGLDLNPNGVTECRKRGHDVRQQTAADFFRTTPERRFDLVTSFEVMEHVPNPADFFASAAALIRPGGGLVFSVPNDSGLPGLARLIPHQWPPHHLTLWRGSNLKALAEKNRLQVVSIETDPLSWGMVRHFLNLQRGLEFTLGRRNSVPGNLIPRLAAWAYRFSGAQLWLPPQGTSITLTCRLD